MWVTQPLSFYLYSSSSSSSSCVRRAVHAGSSSQPLAHCVPAQSPGRIPVGDASVGSGASSVLLQSSLWNFLAVRSKAPFSAGLCSVSKDMGIYFPQAMQSWALL